MLHTRYREQPSDVRLAPIYNRVPMLHNRRVQQWTMSPFVVY